MKRESDMKLTRRVAIAICLAALAGAGVEGLNNKARVVTRRSYGFRAFPVLETALFHTLGKLPEPELTHRFC